MDGKHRISTTGAVLAIIALWRGSRIDPGPEVSSGARLAAQRAKKGATAVAFACRRDIEVPLALRLPCEVCKVTVCGTALHKSVASIETAAITTWLNAAERSSALCACEVKTEPLQGQKKPMHKNPWEKLVQS